jgi:hypothetical protein
MRREFAGSKSPQLLGFLSFGDEIRFSAPRPFQQGLRAYPPLAGIPNKNPVMSQESGMIPMKAVRVRQRARTLDLSLRRNTIACVLNGLEAHSSLLAV